jgi:hypothetical protein
VLGNIFTTLLHSELKFEEKNENICSRFPTTPKQAISRRRVQGDGRFQILRMRISLPEARLYFRFALPLSFNDMLKVPKMCVEVQDEQQS